MQSISKLPGFIYLALGDPLQKRNYYRAGWIKFTDEADMPTIMAELSEKKVRSQSLAPDHPVAQPSRQIEGFKLHVSHITKPFVTRVRHTPEVASKPDRLVKDLENAKKLAALMEEEYMRLRKAKVEEKPKENGDSATNGDKPEAPAEDTTIADAAEDAEDPEPREMGSEAVERRVEKVLADLHEQGAVDTSDEKALEAKRVRSLPFHRALCLTSFGHRR